ncbi:MAG: peptidylprolyl isomerase [Alphaproteobacteria bacterium]|nr:MAG: peptidylprolyl isomerase [Alphaproteobacteria bacterium]
MKKIAGVILGAALGMAALPALAGDGTEPSADTVVATVNGTEITLGHVIAFRERLPEQYQQLPDDVLFKGIVDQLIQQQALADVLDQNPTRRNLLGLENQSRAFKASEMLDRLSAVEIPEADLRAAYDERFANRPPEMEYNASHILVKTREEAEEIIKELEAGADFAELAKEKSTGPSAANGGKLGWFGKGMMVKPFEDAVVALEPGQISGPVETQFGWHVIRLDEVREKPAPTFEEVREQLAAELKQARIDAEVERLTAEAKVERPEIEFDPAAFRNGELID